VLVETPGIVLYKIEEAKGLGKVSFKYLMQRENASNYPIKQGERENICNPTS